MKCCCLLLVLFSAASAWCSVGSLITARAAFSDGTQPVTITWNPAFPDTNYTAVCTAEFSPVTNLMLPVITSRSPGSMTVIPTNVTLPAFLDCIAIADSSLPNSDIRSGRQQFAGAQFFVTVTWNSAFPDTNYVPVCTAETSSPTDNQLLSLLTSVTTTSVTFVNQTIVAGTIHCIGVPGSPSEPIALGIGTPTSLNVPIPWIPANIFPDTNYAAVCSFVILVSAAPSAVSVEAKSVPSATAFITANQGGTVDCIGVGYDTSTTLSVNPGPTVQAGQVVSLVASVTSNSLPVNGGTVTFFSGTQPLGTVQVTSMNGIATATLKTRFAPTENQPLSLTAHYNGTNQLGASSSAPQPLMVTGTEQTIGKLGAVPDGSNYDFALNVFGFGLAATHPPTGTASLDELQNPPIHLGDFTLAGQGVSTFQPQQTYATGANPLDIAAADFNGDGIPDLAAPSFSDATVSVLLGKGDGTFQPQQTYATGASPQGIAVGDFNGDGFADLAVVNNGDGTVSVLLGNGDGTFQPQTVYEVVSGPTHVAVADFNGDGFPDLVTTNGSSRVVSALLGNGDGSFQSPQTYAAGTDPYRIAVADFNGDGFADLAVDNLGGTTVSVLLGNGDGTFQPQQMYATGNAPRGVAVGDFNGDGIADMAVTNFADDTVSVLLGNGDGTFKPQQTYPTQDRPSAIAVTDFNGDGIADLAVANVYSSSVSVLLGKGDGTFLPQQAYAVGQPGEPTGIALADYNGDAVPDVAFPLSGTPGSIGVLLGGSMTSAYLLNIAVPGQGQQSVNATYTPDTPFYTGNTSNTVVVTANPAATITTLTADFTTIGISQTVTFKATVAGSVNPPAGTVTFTADGTNLCTAVAVQPAQNTSTAVCQYAFLTMGSHSIVAMYSGDTFYLPSMSSPLTETIGLINDYVVTLQVSSPDQGASITLTAMVQPPQNCLTPCPGKAQFTPTGTVDFYTDIGDLGAQPLDANATATLTTSNAGNFTVIYAHYSGDTNFAPATSNPMNSLAPPIVVTMQTTTAGATTPTPITLTVQFPNDGNTYYKVITCNSVFGRGITCTPDPANITANPLMANVDIKTTATVAYLGPGQRPGRDGYRVFAAVLPFGVFGIVWLAVNSARGRRKLLPGMFLLIVVCAALLSASCGGGNFAPAIPPGGNVAGTPPGQYQITGYATLYRVAGQGTGSPVQVGTPQYFLIHLLVK